MVPNWKNERSVDGVMYGFARCPGCGERVVFLLVSAEPWRQGEERDVELFMYPPLTREPLEGVEDVDQFSEGLERAYASAINVYNTREWSGATVLIRRTLEGVTKTSLPESEQGKPLFAQIQALPDHVDLAQPIKQLAHALRSGGNLGDHFDLEKEPDEETASLMLELLDSLIEYLYVLPSGIEALEEKIQNLAT